MKQLLLFALLLGGCAALQPPRTNPVDVATPVEVESSQPEVSQPTGVITTLPTVVTPVETNVNVAKATRFILEYPQTYSKYIPRVEKFFQLALIDPTVINRSKFDESEDTPDMIKAKIRNGFEVFITTYKPSIWKGGKWSSVVGYHSDGVIYLNTYYINRPDCEVINTLVHEPMHTLGYGHGDNSSVGKDGTVPYWMGDRAQELCEQGRI